MADAGAPRTPPAKPKPKPLPTKVAVDNWLRRSGFEASKLEARNQVGENTYHGTPPSGITTPPPLLQRRRRYHLLLGPTIITSITSVATAVACREGRTDIVRWLKAKKVGGMDALDELGSSPLKEAIENKNDETVTFLLAQGADIDRVSNLHMRLQLKAEVKLLVKAGKAAT